MSRYLVLLVIILLFREGAYSQDDDENYDFGDAPSSYGIVYHRIDNKNFLGSRVDSEEASIFSASADGDDNDGDDDEDGVVFSQLIQGEDANIYVGIWGEGYLSAWFDWNGDGDFQDDNERVLLNLRRSNNYTLRVSVPENAGISGPVIARFRFGDRISSWEFNGAGSSDYGEVEDYAIDVGCSYIPTAPVPGTITHPTCSVTTGSVLLNGLPSSGNWTLTRSPGGVTTYGSGTSRTIQGLAPGTYYFTVTNNGGCTSPQSRAITINEPLSLPSPPSIANVTHPTCAVPGGTVFLSGLPAGNWTINPGSVDGSGNSAVIRELQPGTYRFTVTNSQGCTSPQSSPVVMPAIRSDVILSVKNPAPVCTPLTVDITADSLVTGSKHDLTLTYWLNPQATEPLVNARRATAGTYYIKGTSASSECFDVEAITVRVTGPPDVNAGPDQELDYQFETAVNAEMPEGDYEGVWNVLRGKGTFANPSEANTTVRGLAVGTNILIWTVTDRICPPVSDSIKVFVRDISLPTLITPNLDGNNDFFIVDKLEVLGKVELIIYDRRGVMVFRDDDYSNDWNGNDYKDNPLPEDTYFYVLKAANGKSSGGFIVIRR